MMDLIANTIGLIKGFGPAGGCVGDGHRDTSCKRLFFFPRTYQAVDAATAKIVCSLLHSLLEGAPVEP